MHIWVYICYKQTYSLRFWAVRCVCIYTERFSWFKDTWQQVKLWRWSFFEISYDSWWMFSDSLLPSGLRYHLGKVRNHTVITRPQVDILNMTKPWEMGKPWKNSKANFWLSYNFLISCMWEPILLFEMYISLSLIILFK